MNQLSIQPSLAILAGLLVVSSASAAHASETYARGVVFNDINKNGVRDRGEPGVRGVSVSNGLDVVKTDRRGRYRLPVDDETVIFITQPRGWNVPVNDVQLPQFYYINYPNGTPPVASWLFPVIDPTGPLPASVDFPLHRARRARRRGRYDEVVDWGRRGRRRNQFKALAFADPQAGSFSQFLAGGPNEFGNRQLSDLRDEFISGLIGTKADFVMVAGDVINDDLTLYPRHNRIMAAMGIPVWNVPGNHDMNIKSPNDRYSTQTFIRVFGPDNYSFEYGDVHFVAMNNVFFKGNLDPFGAGTGNQDRFTPGFPEGGSTYKGFFTPQQLQWLANDLQYVDPGKLVVIYTHISLKTLAISGANSIGAANINTENLSDLMAVLDGHPNVYSFSGHDTSNLWTLWLGAEEGRDAHLPPVVHKKIAEVRVSLGGPKDDRGVRVSHTQDGNPNGYYYFDFDGPEIVTHYQSAYSRINNAKVEDDFQLRISVGVNIDHDAIEDLSVPCPTPDDDPAIGPRNSIVVNAFDSNARHHVEFSLDGGPYQPLGQMIRETDVVTDPDELVRPAGTAWCRDPFMTRYSARINQFLTDVNADLTTTEAGRTRISSPQPSSTIWAAEIPMDLAPGAHVIKVRRVDEHGNLATGNKVFEVCDPASTQGEVEGRDCYVLGPR
ncbi:MAG: metallophosphoesterase N-terminal domain-containing protein [Myxococcota bacterium]